MASDEPGVVISLCASSHLRLLATVAAVDDQVVRRPSLLPGWTIGHVLTHLARNADGHARRLAAALRGEDLPRYPGGREQRASDIDAGAGRSAAALAEDVAASARELERVWQECESAGWPNAGFLGADEWPVTASPLRRRREVEIHHADLGMGYSPADWPDDYVAWELRESLAGLPGRLRDGGDARRFLAWLIGRSPLPEKLDLAGW